MNRYRHTAFLPVVLALVATIDAGPVAAEPVRAVEYYHETFEHYFVTSDALEIAALEQGRMPGWWPTGQRYYVGTEPGPGWAPACRFFTAAFANKASHFFTANMAECDAVKANPDWTFEGIAFHVIPADAQGGCVTGTTAVHRLYNNGRGGAPNHAYTVDATKGELLASLGWTREGTAFCVPVYAHDPVGRLQVLAGARWDLPAWDPDYAASEAQTTFAQTLTLDGSLDSGLAAFGLPAAPAAISHSAIGPWSGIGFFDRVSASYRVVGGPGHDNYYLGIEWNFESASSATMPVCQRAVMRNPRTPGSALHPFQPFLRTGCFQSVGRRR